MRDGDAERLIAALDDVIQQDIPLSPILSIRTGGPAKLFLSASNERGICRAVEEARRLDIPILLIGNGSNTLMADTGFDGLVIHFGPDYSDIVIDSDFVEVASGALLPVVAKRVAEASLTGFEFASGIPGSIGGAVFMNAGAFGRDFSMIVDRVRCMTPDGDVVEIERPDMAYGYRTSRFMQEGLIVLHARLKLAPGNKDEILELMARYTAERRAKQPLNYPSAGSFFRRPEGYFAGALIEQSGLKGRRVGGAAVSTLHAGFLINLGDASTEDFITLMHEIQGEVLTRFGVQLENEVRIVGVETA